MRLQSYLDRIGFHAAVRADEATLRALLRAHAFAVPFENLDVQLGRPLSIDVEAAFDKLVERRRGGWCYEQNGLFGWALAEIGFDVTRVAAAVMRQVHGDSTAANHLCLLVRAPGCADAWLADVGFGGSLLAPVPLTEGRYRHAPFDLGLEALADGYWRFWEDAGDGRFCFDFRAEAGSEDALAAKCRVLQNDPGSTFVLNLIAQRRSPDRHTTLRGRVLRNVTSSGTTTRTLDSAPELVRTLESVFGLDVPEIVDAWPRIVARHDALFAAAAPRDARG